MTQGVIVAVIAALIAYFLSGARRPVYLLYCLGIVPFVTLEMDSGGLVSGAGLMNPNTIFKMSLRLLTTGGFLFFLFTRRRSFSRLWRIEFAPVLFFVTWGLISSFQSQVPLISIIRLGELLVFFLAGIVLCTDAMKTHGPRKTARWHCFPFVQVLLTALYFSQTNPELAFHVSADGVGRLGHKFINANSLGFACVVIALWSTAELREKREGVRGLFFERVVPLLALGLAAYALYQTRSRTALITMIVGQLILWIPIGSRKFWALPSFVLLCFTVLLVAAWRSDLAVDWILRGASVADLQSATGRLGLWSALLGEQLPQAPILGAGYLMLGSEGGFFHNGTHWSNAHNTYMFALIASGIPGFLAIVMIAVAPWYAMLRKVLAAKSETRPFWILLFAIQTVIVIAGFTGFGICGYPNPVMYLHYGLLGYTLSRLRSSRREAIPSIDGWSPSPRSPLVRPAR
jgi:O-antigen ligase